MMYIAKHALDSNISRQRIVQLGTVGLGKLLYCSSTQQLTKCSVNCCTKQTVNLIERVHDSSLIGELLYCAHHISCLGQEK